MTEPLAQPVTTPLEPDEVDALLERLPPLPKATSDFQDLALPPTTIPPPRTGVTIQEPFPPPATPPPTVMPESTPLEVLRYSPEGDVPLAPNLSVTFNQPMVALTGLQDWRARRRPSNSRRCRPDSGAGSEPKRCSSSRIRASRWRQPTRSKSRPGQNLPTAHVLASAVTWSFTTPPPSVLQFWPSGSGLPLDPLMVATFDQAIDPAAVLEAIMVRADGATIPLRLATDAELDGDKIAGEMIERAGEGRWIAFRAQEPFAPAASVVVAFGPGLPSAEGPLKTEKSQEFTFETHGPLSVVRQNADGMTTARP